MPCPAVQNVWVLCKSRLKWSAFLLFFGRNGVFLVNLGYFWDIALGDGVLIYAISYSQDSRFWNDGFF